MANSMGVPALDIGDDPEEILGAFRRLALRCEPGPFLLNINCERERWHAGSGIDNPPKKSTLSRLGFSEEDIKRVGLRVADVWKQVRYEAV